MNRIRAQSVRLSITTPKVLKKNQFLRTYSEFAFLLAHAAQYAFASAAGYSKSYHYQFTHKRSAWAGGYCRTPNPGCDFLTMEIYPKVNHLSLKKITP